MNLLNPIFFSLLLISSSFSLAWSKETGTEGPSYNFKGTLFKLDPLDKVEKRTSFDKSALEDDSSLSDYPTLVDLRALQSAVKTQGDRGSCAFFTTNALLESLIKSKQGLEVNLSEEYLVWKVKGDLKIRPHGDGSLAQENVNGVIKGGLVLERDLSYQPSWFNEGLPCHILSSERPSSSLTCYSHYAPSAQVMEKVISADGFVPETFSIDFQKAMEILAKDQRPVIVGVSVNPRGWNAQTGEVEMTDEMAEECNLRPGVCGGHSILLVGYDREKRHFIFKNSWGSDWGQAGYGTIPFDYVEGFARNSMVTGRLENPLAIPLDYDVFPERKSELQNNLLVKDGLLLNSFQGTLGSMQNTLFYVSSFLVTPKEEGEISDTNSKVVPVHSGFETTYGKSVKGVFKKIMSEEGLDVSVSGATKIPLKIIDKSALEGKEPFIRFSSYYHSDMNGWELLERRYEKLSLPLE